MLTLNYARNRQIKYSYVSKNASMIQYVYVCMLNTILVYGMNMIEYVIHMQTSCISFDRRASKHDPSNVVPYRQSRDPGPKQYEQHHLVNMELKRHPLMDVKNTLKKKKKRVVFSEIRERWVSIFVFDYQLGNFITLNLTRSSCTSTPPWCQPTSTTLVALLQPWHLV